MINKLIIFYGLCFSPGGMCLDKAILLYMMCDATSRETVAMAKSSLLNLQQQHVGLTSQFCVSYNIYK